MFDDLASLLGCLAEHDFVKDPASHIVEALD